MNILGSAAKWRHRANAQTTAKYGSVVSSVHGVASPLCVFWVFFFGFGLVPFLFWTTLFASWGSVSFVSVLCQEAQCRFRWRHPTPVRGVIFLLKLFFTHDSRYAPWLAHTGREYHTALWRPTSCCVTVRLRAGYAPVTFRSKKALVQLAVSNRTLTSVLQLLCFFKSLHCSVTRGDS